MPSEDIVTINVDIDDVFDYDDLTSVGRVYQCGINGVGYMLADTPEQPAYRKQLVPLDPERLATSDTPFSQAIERYNFGTLADGTAGAGQKWLNRASSTSTAFYSSEGVDPFTTPGEMTLLNTASTEEIDDTYSGLLLTVVGRNLYALTDAKELTYVTTPGGSETAITINSGAGTVTGLTSDGQYWYAADGADIYRGTTSGGVSVWADDAAVDVLWAGGRICAAVKDTGSSTPNSFQTINDAGDLERAHITFPDGSTVHLGGETAGHVYFGVENGNVGSIWAWPMGLNDSGAHHYPFEALELPSGMAPTAVGVGGGFVWVRAHRPEGTSKGQTVIFQCVPDQNGALIANLVAELAPVGTTADHSVGDFASNGDFMYFSWKTMSNSKAGVGAAYLPTGGYAQWYEAGADGDVASIDVWQGLPVMAVRGQGVYRVDTAAYVTTSNIVTSVIDGGSSLDKIWDDVTIVHDPLPANGSIQVHYSLDKGGSWTSLGTSASAGTKNQTFSLGKTSKTLMLKATIALSSGSTAPKLSIMQARFHPIGLKDEVIQLTIDCGDQLKGLNGHPLPENGYGAGAKRANTLEGLVQQRVKFQDIDWHIQGSSLVYDCESVDIGATILYDNQTSGQKIRLLATLTLRKAS